MANWCDLADDASSTMGAHSVRSDKPGGAAAKEGREAERAAAAERAEAALRADDARLNARLKVVMAGGGGCWVTVYDDVSRCTTMYEGWRAMHGEGWR